MTADNPAIREIAGGHRPPLQWLLLFNHSRRNRIVVLIDEDEAAGLAVHAVGVAYHRLKCLDSHLTDVVSLKFRYGRFTLKRVHVQPVIDLTDDGANRFRCVAQGIPLIQMQLLFTYPTQRRFEFRPDLWWLWLAGNHISAPNVEIVGQRQGNGLTGECLLKKTIVRHDSCDRGSRV